jgi:hypothetical protein
MSKGKSLSDEEIITMFKDFANRLGRTPKKKDIENERKTNKNFITGKTIQRRFGGTNNLAKVCGLNPNVILLSNEELIESLKGFYNKNKFIPSKRQFKNYSELPNISYYERRFGGILNAVEKANIPLNEKQIASKNQNKLSKEEVKHIFIEFYNKKKFIPKSEELQLYDLPPISTIVYQYKNYTNFLKECNIDISNDSERFIKHRNMTDEELITYIQDYYKSIGFPTEREFNSKNNLPSYTLYFQKFGSFKNAILISGIDIPENKIHYFDREQLSDEEMLTLLKYYTNEKLKNDKYLLSGKDIDNNKSMPHSGTYVARFGGIVKSYEKIGINYQEYNKKVLEQDMIDKYLRLYKKLGYTPDSREIDRESNKNQCYSMTTYISHFGSLYHLQQLCGLTPTGIGRNKSDKDLIIDLQTLNKILGRIPTVYDLKDFDFCASQRKYSYVFNSYANALIKAGFKPNTKFQFTKNNTLCNSSYDYMMTKMLENHNIIFSKEDYYRDYILDFDKAYRFDFIIIINNNKYFIEIFGIEGNDKYDKKKLEKIQLCKDNNIPLIQYYPDAFLSNNQEELYFDFIDKVLDCDEQYYDNKLN